MTSPKPKPRNLTPRAPIVICPVYVSDLTACSVFGFRSARRVRAFVYRHGVPHANDGRAFLIAVDDLRATLERLAGRAVVELRDDEEGACAEGEEEDDAAAEGEEAILTRIGLKSTRPAKGEGEGEGEGEAHRDETCVRRAARG